MIVVGGEALIDLVTADGEQLGAHAGGGPFNTSRALARLERPVAYLGRLSTDRFGERLAGLLAADGVRLDLAVRTEDPTTLALAELDADGGATYRFYFEGTSAPGLTENDAAAVGDATEILHVGTLGLVFEPMADTLEALAARLAGRALVMVDPNCRPSVIADAAAYRARIRRVLASADVSRSPTEDLAWLSPGSRPRTPRSHCSRRGRASCCSPAAATARRCSPRTARPTSQRRGCGWSTPSARATRSQAAGSRGGPSAGTGATSSGTRRSLAEATRFAVRVAAETCARAGASPPTRAELGA